MSCAQLSSKVNILVSRMPSAHIRRLHLSIFLLFPACVHNTLPEILPTVGPLIIKALKNVRYQG